MPRKSVKSKKAWRTEKRSKPSDGTSRGEWSEHTIHYLEAHNMDRCEARGADPENYVEQSGHRSRNTFCYGRRANSGH